MNNKLDKQQRISKHVMAGLSKFESKIKYKFKDIMLLNLALTHRSLTTASNERLEFLGDATFNLIISDYLYTKYADAKEGVLSRVRAKIVSKITLQKIALSLNIRDFIQVGLAENKNIANQLRRTSIVSDAVEAVIGAVYIDGGATAAQSVVMRLFKDELGKININDLHKDYKTQLQEIIQSNYHRVPQYMLKQEKMLAGNEREFIVHCRVPNHKGNFVGKGASRKEAEQEAARATLSGLYDNSLHATAATTSKNN